jgi:ferredoxin
MDCVLRDYRFDMRIRRAFNHAPEGVEKMKSIRLMYFSGTGNTELAADMLARNFRERGCVVSMEKIGRERGACAVPLSRDGKDRDEGECGEILGIGAPVIGFGTPSIVLDFVRKLPAGNGKKAFVFRTAGGVIPGNYNSSRDLIAILERKGYDVFNERLFSIGSNWMIRFSNGAMKKLHDATKIKVEAYCADILDDKRFRYETGKKQRFTDAMLRGLSRIVLRFLATDFRASPDCTGCGLCAERCPKATVRMKKGKPRFGSDCASCMRCVYACPQKAIQLKSLAFLQLKEGYDVKDILEHPEPWSDEGTKAEPPFMARYIADSQE